ncbi:MAG: YigZ family protein [Bacteroidota bacterium]
MLFDDTYKTIHETSEGTFRDKGSKFIAYLYPLGSESEVRDIINSLKSVHPKANHYCWAFRLSTDRSVFRVNDDGEPSGTAGRPILNTLLSYDITNVLVVVVRYFGGTLLGVPGLINAYKKATIEAINNSVITELSIRSLYEIKFEHPQINEVMKVVKEEQLNSVSQSFDTICVIQLEIRQSAQERILARFNKIKSINLKYISSL